MIENPLAVEVLAGRYGEGDTVVVEPGGAETLRFRKESPAAPPFGPRCWSARTAASKDLAMRRESVATFEVVLAFPQSPRDCRQRMLQVA
jgi:hypothetical protein